MIFGANFKTIVSIAAAILLALYLPLYAAWGLAALAMCYAMFRISRLQGAPNGLPLAEKPAVWMRSAKAYGMLAICGLYGAVTMGRTTNALDLQPMSGELGTVIIMAATCGIMSFAGFMMSSLLKGQAIHSQQRADAEAAAGNGPKCTCTRKCGMC